MWKSVFISWVLAIVCLGSAEQVQAARLVKIRVYVGEIVVLEGSTSDDGSPDADTVWNYLREVQMKPTDQFAKFADQLTVDDDFTELTASGRITVSYGGRKDFKKIAFTRVLDENGVTQYRLAPELIEMWFDSRLITRREAAGLFKPKLK